MFLFAGEAWPYLLIFGGATIFTWLIGWCVAPYLFFILTLFTAFFFRDPYRKVTLGAGHAVSPADGKVQAIEDIGHDEFIGGPAKKISIFLSIFNVHINRSPTAGKVLLKSYRAGKMLPAYKSHASDENERATIGLEVSYGRVLVHQITGLIARRIVTNVNVGDNLKQGERFGLIKFGSCTELIVPASAEVTVALGDKVKGGVSVIAKFAK